MAFEDVIASLGRDLGIDLVAEDGVAGFVATSEDGSDRIEGAQLSGDPAEVADSIGMENFIRV